MPSEPSALDSLSGRIDSRSLPPLVQPPPQILPSARPPPGQKTTPLRISPRIRGWSGRSASPVMRQDAGGQWTWTGGMDILSGDVPYIKQAVYSFVIQIIGATVLLVLYWNWILFMPFQSPIFWAILCSIPLRYVKQCFTKEQHPAEAWLEYNTKNCSAIYFKVLFACYCVYILGNFARSVPSYVYVDIALYTMFIIMCLLLLLAAIHIISVVWYLCAKFINYIWVGHSEVLIRSFSTIPDDIKKKKKAKKIKPLVKVDPVAVVSATWSLLFRAFLVAKRALNVPYQMIMKVASYPTVATCVVIGLAMWSLTFMAIFFSMHITLEATNIANRAWHNELLVDTFKLPEPGCVEWNPGPQCGGDTPREDSEDKEEEGQSTRPKCGLQGLEFDSPYIALSYHQPYIITRYELSLRPTTSFYTSMGCDVYIIKNLTNAGENPHAHLKRIDHHLEIPEEIQHLDPTPSEADTFVFVLRSKPFVKSVADHHDHDQKSITLKLQGMKDACPINAVPHEHDVVDDGPPTLMGPHQHDDEDEEDEILPRPEWKEGGFTCFDPPSVTLYWFGVKEILDGAYLRASQEWINVTKKNPGLRKLADEVMALNVWSAANAHQESKPRGPKMLALQNKLQKRDFDLAFFTSNIPEALEEVYGSIHHYLNITNTEVDEMMKEWRTYMDEYVLTPAKTTGKAVAGTIGFAITAAKHGLQFVLECLIFLKVLFMLLLASEDPIIELLTTILPFELQTRSKLRLYNAFHRNIRGVFLSTLKIAIFHALYTWLVYQIFGASFPYTFTLFASIISIIPVFPLWILYIPGSIELIIHSESEVLNFPIPSYATGIAFFLAGFWLYWGNLTEAVLLEIPEAPPPYITALSVWGGMAALGTSGVILGPVVVTLPYIGRDFYRLYRDWNEKTAFDNFDISEDLSVDEWMMCSGSQSMDALRRPSPCDPTWTPPKPTNATNSSQQHMNERKSPTRLSRAPLPETQNQQHPSPSRKSATIKDPKCPSPGNEKEATKESAPKSPGDSPQQGKAALKEERQAKEKKPGQEKKKEK